MVSVYNPTAPPLANTVHDWAKVLLTEVLQRDEENYQGFQTLGGLKILWQLLERARIGLSGLGMSRWAKRCGVH